MATRAEMIMRTGEKEYKSIYNHSDGYPSYLGNVLLKHYKDEEKVKSLIDNGSISFIQKDGTVLESDLYHEPAVVSSSPGDWLDGGDRDYLYLYDKVWKFKWLSGEGKDWTELTFTPDAAV